MGMEQPYLYDAPSRNSLVAPSEKGFNPRAATQASWSPMVQRPQANGPLIATPEMNRHPDSYFVVPYGNLNWKPMSPRTKHKVKWTRMMQLALRVLALLGALGMLFCVICVKGTDITTGWIIRVPAGVAIMHCVYAIYHLAKPSSGRTPASSASYMLFAAFIDIGLVPFYVFTALMARSEYEIPAGTAGRWQTLFNDDVVTYKIIYATFLISIVDGGLHLVSFAVSIYLGVIFRKISRLPPDMNPLEDNLTSRHKRNKSSLMESRVSQGTTLTPGSTRDSKISDPLISPVRSVPFMHTRNDSNTTLREPHVPNFSPRASRIDVAAPFYDQPLSHRSSGNNTETYSSNNRAPSQAPSNRTSRTHFPNLMLQRQPLPQSTANEIASTHQDQQQQNSITRSPTKSSSIYSTSTFKTNTTTPGRTRSTAPSLPDSNWITYPSPSPSPSPPLELKHLRNKTYHSIPQTDENLAPTNPLELNPPTPPIEGWRQHQNNQAGRALTPGTGNVARQYQRQYTQQQQQPRTMNNWGPGMVGIGKARAWGVMNDWAVGRGNSVTSKRNDNNNMNSRGRGAGGGRVVSRSGVEVMQGGILPSGGMRAREVSGKVMEEGRGAASSTNWSVVS